MTKSRPTTPGKTEEEPEVSDAAKAAMEAEEKEKKAKEEAKKQEQKEEEEKKEEEKVRVLHGDRTSLSDVVRD